MSIELFTTNELIQELTKRSTFVGVIVHSQTENRNNTNHKDFTVYDGTGGNLTTLLGHVIEECESGGAEIREA